MSYPFNPGDDLIFQLESGFGLLRVLAVEGEGSGTVWHLLAYDDFFPDVEAAEAALAATPLPVRKPARLGNRPVTDDELVAYKEWLGSDRPVSDRSALLMLGVR
jgi:hypothetical protein